MKSKILLLAVCAFVWPHNAATSSEPTAAQDFETVQDYQKLPLSASYALRTKDTDPPEGMRLDRLNLEITGKEAERIFKQMIAPAQNTDCEGQVHENYTRKVAGNFECVKDGSAYECTVGIDLDTGAAVEGYVCD